jgi:hypothetical protein
LRAGPKDIVELIGLLKQCSVADAAPGKGGRPLCEHSPRIGRKGLTPATHQNALFIEIDSAPMGQPYQSPSLPWLNQKTRLLAAPQ